MKYQELLNKFPVKLQLPVQWGDMDAFQHVNNVRYLRWFESARVEYMQYLPSIELSGETAIGVIVGAIECKYLFPVTYPDTIDLGIRIENLEAEKFDMVCQMFSQQHQRIVTIAKAKIVIYDYVNFRRAKLTDEMLAEIRALENQK